MTNELLVRIAKTGIIIKEVLRKQSAFSIICFGEYIFFILRSQVFKGFLVLAHFKDFCKAELARILSAHRPELKAQDLLRKNVLLCAA